MIVPLSHVILLSFVIFLIGIAGLVTRRDAITIFLSVELMLNAANIAFVAYARALGDHVGHVMVFVVIAVAAVEAAIGLSLVIRMKEHFGTLDMRVLRELKG